MKRRVSTLLLLCWLCVAVLAASPALHESLHGADAEHGEHECVATLLAEVGFDTVTTQPIIVGAPMMTACARLGVRDADLRAIFTGRSRSDRGPPIVVA